MKISFKKLREEWQYAFDERIGIMTEGDLPSADQERVARDEADAHMEKVKIYLEKQK
jgi:hypothetical protein